VEYIFVSVKKNSGMVDFNKKKSSKFILNIINKLVNKVY
jgi:hypothetical protein